MRSDVYNLYGEFTSRRGSRCGQGWCVMHLPALLSFPPNNHSAYLEHLHTLSLCVLMSTTCIEKSPAVEASGAVRDGVSCTSLHTSSCNNRLLEAYAMTSCFKPVFPNNVNLVRGVTCR